MRTKSEQDGKMSSQRCDLENWQNEDFGLG